MITTEEKAIIKSTAQKLLEKAKEIEQAQLKSKQKKWVRKPDGSYILIPRKKNEKEAIEQHERLIEEFRKKANY